MSPPGTAPVAARPAGLGRLGSRAPVGWLAPVVAGGLGAALVGVATGPHGPGLSPDSAVYLSTGDALAHGDGFQAYGAVPLTDFPPGYPLALAGWLWALGGGTGAAARAVNALSVLVLVVLAGLVLRRYVHRTWLLGAGVVLVAAAPGVLHTAVTAWSETLFAAAIMAATLFLARAVQGWRMLDVALAGACASACVTVRFVGAGVVLAGLVALVLAGRWGTPTGARPGLGRRCAAFLGLAALAPAAWVASRLQITDSPLGVRAPPRADLFENVGDAATWIVHWFVPDTLPGPARAVGYAGLAAAAGAALWAGARALSRDRGSAARVRFDPGLWLPGLMAASVVAVTVVGASLTETDPLDFRLLSPALAPTVVLVVVVVDRILDLRPGRAAAVLAAGLLVAWMAALAVADARVWRDARRGEGYASAQWRGSELARLLRRSPPGGSLYSNQPDAVWLLSRRDARCPPRALATIPCGGLSVPSDERKPVRPPAGLAWFRVPGAGSAPRGNAACRLSPVAAVRDGILFGVTGGRCGTA